MIHPSDPALRRRLERWAPLNDERERVEVQPKLVIPGQRRDRVKYRRREREHGRENTGN